MDRKKAVVFGATGLVGEAALRTFAAAGFETVGISRRGPDLQLDLTNGAACRDQLRARAFDDVSHLVFAALYERPALIAGWREPVQIETNRLMFEHALDPFADRAALRHVTLLQGTKAYAAHLRPMRVPGREREPRPDGANFYWQQEDHLRAAAAGKAWSFGILRPQVVCGHAIGSPMNLIIAIGVYAAVMRELGQPLRFPGGGECVTEVTDADLLARAVLWAATTPRCRGETFNVTNGDVVTWRRVVESVAEVFGMDVDAPQPKCLADEMPKHAGVWARIVARDRLRSPDMASLVGSSWQFADAVFGYGYDPHDTLLSTIKIRQFGFTECMDSLDMFSDRLRTLQSLRVLPA